MLRPGLFYNLDSQPLLTSPWLASAVSATEPRLVYNPTWFSFKLLNDFIYLFFFQSARKVSDGIIQTLEKTLVIFLSGNAFLNSAIEISHGWTYLRFGDDVKGLSGLFGGRLPGLPFPGGGAGFLGGTNGAAGFAVLWSGTGRSADIGNQSLITILKRLVQKSIAS